MKTIIASLKAQIEAAKKSIEIHTAAEKKWFDESTKLMKSEPERAEALYKAAEAEYDKLNEARHQLRCYRHALGSILDATHVQYDSFEPEAGC